jgi:serpin B
MSPASIAIALSMARAGARGVTATEMDAVLHDLGADQMGDAINALAAALSARTGTFADAAGVDQAVALHIANALFGQRDMSLEAPYLDALAGRFDAGIWQVDFKADPEAARLAINAWVADQTENRILNILKPGQITTATRLALANAVYLKAAWLTPFDKKATKPGAFSRADGTVVQVPFMQLRTILPYASGTGWQAVQLPYVGGSLAMTVIVPTDLAAFEATLDAATFAKIVGSLKPTSIVLTIPTFDTGSRSELTPILEALGMPTPFDPAKADFSGITTDEALHIGFVIHQANITVDEAGTEAAAATVIGMDTAGPGSTPVELRVDRPFLFALRDIPTTAVVFMGRVADPSITR